jgi:RimJ/RimL family protein N-acetyltransferase
MNRRSESDQPVGDPVLGWCPRDLPAPVVLTGADVVLEPRTDGDVEELFTVLGGPGNAPLWTYLSSDVPHSVEELRVTLSSWPHDWVTFVIRSADRGPAQGTFSLMRIDAANGSVELGSVVFSRALQRTRAATEAVFLVASYVFDELGYRRFEWKCDSLNAPSRAAAARFGFSYEGRFRQAVVNKGRNRDTDWFAMTDADWVLLRPAYERWLAPSNFDDDAQQRVSLSTLTSAALDARAEVGTS